MKEPVEDESCEDETDEVGHVIRYVAKGQAKHIYLDADEPDINYALLRSADRHEWRQAAIKELMMQIKFGTWSIVKESDIPPGTKVLKTGWRCNIKRDAMGNIVKYKCRAYCKGFTQRKGIHYDESTSPTPRAATLRMLLAQGVEHDLLFRQADVVNAYLQTPMDRDDLYMQMFQHASDLIPEHIQPEDRFARINGALYGSVQGARLFHLKIKRLLVEKLNFEASGGDECLYQRARRVSDGKIIKNYDVNNPIPGVECCTMVVYVDDILATVTSEAEWQHVLATLRGDGSPEKMADTLELKDEGELKMFIGVEINQLDDGSVKISHGYKIGKLETMLAGKLPAKLPKIPMKAGAMLPKVQADDPPMTKDEKKYVDSIPYRQVVGSLLHIYCYTRPDIGYALSQLSRHISDPRPVHCEALLQTVGYLVRTRDLGIRYCKGMPRQVDLYCDASYGECVDTRRSTSGWCCLMNGGAVAWGAKRQPCVSLSSTEAELQAVREAAAEMVALKRDLKMIDPQLAECTWRLWEDNMSAIEILKGRGAYSARKHFQIRCAWLRELYTAKLYDLCYVETSQQAADTMTKSLPHDAMSRHRDRMMNVHGASKPTRCALRHVWARRGR